MGKSLGYLVPALRWAAANGERTVVSTNTITLQEQLVGKDLPFLREALTDQPVRFALLKGWRNYLCLQRLEQARAARAHAIRRRCRRRSSPRSQRGRSARPMDRPPISPAPPRPEVWDEVAAEPDLCTRLRCPHFDRLLRVHRAAARGASRCGGGQPSPADGRHRGAAGAQNWSESAVLPAYSRLVIDEGHHLESAASAHLGQTVTRRGLQRLFSRLERRGKGLLPALERRLASADDLLSVASLDLVRVAARSRGRHGPRPRRTAVRVPRRLAHLQDRHAGPPHGRIRRRTHLEGRPRRRRWRICCARSNFWRTGSAWCASASKPTRAAPRSWRRS